MSTINDIGIPDIGPGILQPKLKNRWRVTFAGLGSGGDSKNVSLQAVTASRPSLEFDEVELHRYNSRAWVAGKHNWEPMNLEVEDDASGRATTLIQQQLQKQQWLIGVEGQWLSTSPEGSSYKFVTMLEMLDGGHTVLEKWTMEGCWLKSANYNDLDMSSNEAVKISLIIRFDHARQNVTGLANGVATGGVGPVATAAAPP